MKKLIKITIVVVSTLILSSCSDDYCIQEEGAIVTKSLTLATFNKLETRISGKINISQGNEQSIKVTGFQNIIDNLSTDIINKTMIIDLKGCFNYDNLEINIVVPKIYNIISTGSNDININDFINQEDLSLLITGSGDITVEDFKNLETLTSEITGSGDIVFNNTQLSIVKKASIKSTGSGDYRAFFISANDYFVSSSGSGNCEVNAKNNLDINLTGSGNIYYKGKPKLILKIGGTGSIQDAN